MPLPELDRGQVWEVSGRLRPYLALILTPAWAGRDLVTVMVLRLFDTSPGTMYAVEVPGLGWTSPLEVHRVPLEYLTRKRVEVVSGDALAAIESGLRTVLGLPE